MFLKCPKCQQNNATYEANGRELFIKCQCGYLRCVYSEVGTATITRKVAFDVKTLPKKNTTLHMYLIAIVDSWPKEMTTSALCEMVKGDTKIASNCMRILQHRQLVECLSMGQGKKGGSLWIVSEKARKHFGLPSSRGAQ